MTINLKNSKTEKEFEAFDELVRIEIAKLKPSETIKFKTTTGVFAVHYNKKLNDFCVMMDGHEIERVADAALAADSLLSLYKSSF